MKKKIATQEPTGLGARGFDGNYILVHEKNNKPVLKSETVKNFRGENCGRVTSVDPPRHDGSSGHIYTEKGRPGVYPSVCGLKFVLVKS
jgi:hypothetical protein